MWNINQQIHPDRVMTTAGGTNCSGRGTSLVTKGNKTLNYMEQISLRTKIFF
jgi:hypothetical protein